MWGWVVTVAGIAILSVLCDIVLPEGQTRKYIKTVFGVVVTLVIVQPIIGLFSGDLGDFSLSTDGETEIQGQYIENVTNRQNENKIKSVNLLLGANGIDVKEIVIDGDKSLLVELNCPYSQQSKNVVDDVIAIYFADYDTVYIWH